MNMNEKVFKKISLTCLMSLVIVSCDNNNSNTTAETAPLVAVISNTVAMIEFVEEEKGIAPFKTRLIVSNDFLRFDYGETTAESESGFILYDRKNKIIYNVNDEEKTIMEIHSKRKAVISPIKLKNRDKKIAELTDAPKINNTVPIKYDFSSNEKLCFGIVAVKNLLPMATKALREFQQALADDSTYTLENIPPDMQDPCDLSMNTFTSTRHLKYGFPIQYWSVKGYSRSLVVFDENFKNSEKLFILPEQYKSFTVDELRSGNVK